jgi:ferrous iron transport protein A
MIELTLDRLQVGTRARVLEIRGGRGLERRLTHMGIHPGDIVLIAQSGLFRGPLLIEAHGYRIALGRGVARRVVVAPI